MIAWQYALRELRQRPGRSLLSLFSVVVAVAALVAVTSATATTRLAYGRVFEALAGRADLEVVARGGGHFAEDVAASLRSLPGVRVVLPILHRATILYAHGAKAKVAAVGITAAEPESLAGFQLVAGHFPSAGNQVALESSLATGLRIALGERIRLLTSRGLRRYEVVGLVNVESAVRLRQGGMLLAPLPQLQRDFRSVGSVDALELFLVRGASINQVRDACARRLPAELKVQVPSTRSGLAEETLSLTEVSLNMASSLSFTTAVFIVLTVFMMNVGERRRQIAILRAIGATRRQIIAMVGGEALLLGVAGTVVGIPLGIYGGSFLIRSMAGLLNTTLPENPDLRRALAAGTLLGPVICLLAASIPARRASQVSPLEGLRPLVDLGRVTRYWRSAIAGIVGLGITAACVVGTARGVLPVWASVAGLIVSLVSLVLLLPVALRPFVGLLGYPLGWLFGLEGEMSQRTIIRRVGRSALTIGVLFIAISAAIGTGNAVFSITDDVRNWYQRTITADFLLRPMMPDMSGQEAVRMNESLGDEIARLDGVEQVDAIRLLRVEAAGQEAILVARDFRLYKQVPLDLIAGDPARVLDMLRRGEVVAGSVLAERAHVRVGDALPIIAGTQRHAFRIAGVATEYTFGGSVAYLDRDVARQRLQLQGVDSFLIKVRPEKIVQLRPKLQALAEREGLLLQSFAELQAIVESMVAGVTGGLWVMLSLGLIVGALGVVNTLTMNVLEQTREIGMLRAIGMRRSEVVKTVVGQAAYLGIIGVGGGALSGVLLARTINRSLGTMFGHFVPFAVRPPFLAVLAISGLAIVLLSALLPAWRAARLNPIEATRHE